MKTHNPENERIKRQYFDFLKEAKRQSESSIDAVAMSIARFEKDTGHRSFKSFRKDQAVAFKRHLATARNRATGKELSKATVRATLANLKFFVQWLALQPGYKSKIKYSDSEYFNLSDNDTRIASARRPIAAPTVDQVRRALFSMPADTEIELRDRAVVAFTLLTGARDSAVASAKLKHIDIEGRSFYQDAREVRTKFRKSFSTFFFPVGGDIIAIVAGWVTHLREVLMFGNNDPLFPKTDVVRGTDTRFLAGGLTREHWNTSSSIRKIFKDAFEAVELPYFKPHSFRHTLVDLGERVCSSPEEFKAWSQNLGHEGVMTTFNSYGTVSRRRQREILSGLNGPRRQSAVDMDVLVDAVADRLLERTGIGR